MILGSFPIAEISSARSSGNPNLGEVLYKLAVNFLLYVVLIIVFYMVVRFYLEEETISQDSHTPDIEKEFEMQSTAIEEADDIKDEIESPLLNNQDEISQTTKNIQKPQNIGAFLNVLSLATSNDWKEQEGTKHEVIQRALFCAIGLNLCFCSWALLQERMLTYPYNGEYFINSYGLVFFSRVGGLTLSAYLMYRFNVKWVDLPLYEYSFPSVANMLSSWCQYEALKYVSFPTQVLAKAFKLVPVMLMGKFLHDKTYETYEYVTAATIGFGIYLFLDSSEHMDLSRDFWNNPDGEKGAMCGVVLLLLFLLFDSFTGQWQTRMFQIYKKMSPLQMMLVINAFSAVFSFITLLHQQELTSTLKFVYAHPDMMIHLILFCIFATVGQLFIFYTVKQFGAVVFSVFMS
eukprot:gene6803-13775_t